MITEKMRRSPNVCLRLAQRRRRWTSIEHTLSECLPLLWGYVFSAMTIECTPMAEPMKIPDGQRALQTNWPGLSGSDYGGWLCPLLSRRILTVSPMMGQRLWRWATIAMTLHFRIRLYHTYIFPPNKYGDDWNLGISFHSAYENVYYPEL